MSLRYRLEAECDGCQVQLGGKVVQDSGAGIEGKPAAPVVVLDGEGKPIDPQPAPAPVSGQTAWRVGDNQLLCTACLLGALDSEPCEVWSVTRIQI